jgi:hypothetical protein
MYFIKGYPKMIVLFNIDIYLRNEREDVSIEAAILTSIIRTYKIMLSIEALYVR